MKISDKMGALLEQWERQKWDASESPSIRIDTFIQRFGGDLSVDERKMLLDNILTLDQVNYHIKEWNPDNETVWPSEALFQAGPQGSNEKTVFYRLAPQVEIMSGYTLVERLGSGAFGEVWRATAPGNFPVALKFLPLAAHNVNVERQSLDVMKEIRHPNLLTISGVWENDDFLIIVTSLADESLMDRYETAKKMGKSGMTFRELLPLFQDVARALDYLNYPKPDSATVRQPVAHGDVKPQNILLVGGSVQLGDLGLARTLQKDGWSKHSGNLTVPFAPPEAFDGLIGERSDQFSLAVTWVYLRTGTLPFGTSTAEIISRQKYDKPNLKGLFSAERRVVRRALRRCAKKRFESSGKFVAALSQSVASRKRPMIIAMMSAFALGVIILGLFVYPSDAKRSERFCRRGINSLVVGDFNAAWGAFTEAIRLNPENIAPIYQRGMALVEADRLDEALNDARRLARLAPKSEESFLLLGKIAWKQGQQNTARELLDGAVRLAPNSGRARCFRADLLIEAGKFEDALADLSIALETNPKLAAAWYRRGKIALIQNESEKAVSFLSKAIELNTKIGAYYRERGKAYATLGKIVEAKRDFTRAVAINPNDSDAQTGLDAIMNKTIQ